MASQVKPIPDGFNSISAYLIVKDSVEAMEFYSKAFGGETITRMPGPDGKGTLHAEMRIGNSVLMLSDENPDWGTKSPLTMGCTTVHLHLYVEDADAAFNQAVAAGCEVTQPISDVFWGDRYARVNDPFGHAWSIATHTEDLTPEELDERAKKFLAEMSSPGEAVE
jgi:uncharacterized glyoxalase superfamily protein PhnB